MEYIAIAVAPGIAICLFIFYKDIYNREPKLNLVVSFLLGCAAIFPAVFLEKSMSTFNDNTIAGLAIFSYGVVALSEEFSKFLSLRLYAYTRKSFDEPFDGIVYSVMVGMGFATLENIFYVLKYAQVGQGLEVGLKRMFLSVPAHGTFAVLMGYFAGLAKFNKSRGAFLLLCGLLAAVLFHGSFDYFIFLNERKMVNEQEGDILLAGGALVSFIVALILSRKLIKQQRKVSQQMFGNKKDQHA